MTELGGCSFFSVAENPAVANEVYLFGGYGVFASKVQGFQNAVYQFTPATNTLNRLFGNNTEVYAGRVPPSRQRALTWLVDVDTMAILGGEASDLSALGDAWLFNVPLRIWRDVSPCHSYICAARYGGVGAYNASIPGQRSGSATWIHPLLPGKQWFFGGRASDTVLKADVWMLEVVPGSTTSASLAWTWVGGSSTDNAPGSTTWPGAREDAALWLDPATGATSAKVYLYGGRGVNGGLYADVWVFDLTATSATATLLLGPATTFVSNTSAVYPSNPGGVFSAFAWTGNGLLWLFGGSGGVPALWTFDPATNQWSGVADYSTNYVTAEKENTIAYTPATHPNARYAGGVVTQPDTGAVWLIGGSGTAVDGSEGLLGDFFSATACDPACVTCNGPSNTDCLSCVDGEYLQVGIGCLPCPGGCALCGAGGVCTSCSNNAVFVSDGTCGLCDANCATCNGTAKDNCLSCGAGASVVKGNCQACPESGCGAQVSNLTMSVIIVISLAILVIISTVLALRRPIDVFAETTEHSAFATGAIFEAMVIRLSLTKLFLSITVTSKLSLELSFTERYGNRWVDRPIPAQPGEDGTFSMQITRAQMQDLLQHRMRVTVAHGSLFEEVVPNFVVRKKLSNFLAVTSMILEFLQMCAISFSPAIPWSNNDPLPPGIHQILLVIRVGLIWRIIYWLVFLVAMVWLSFMILIFTKKDRVLSQKCKFACWKQAETFIYGYFLPFFGQTLYLTILSVMLSAAACTPSVTAGDGSIEVNSQRLLGDETILCWIGQHWAYMFFALMVVLFYYPVAVLALPLWQNTSAGLDIRYQPSFLLIAAQIKFMMAAITSLFPSTAWLQPTVVLVAMPVMIYALSYRPPSHIRWVQPTLICSYVAVMWAAIASAFALGLHGNIAASILLYIGWAIILGVLIFIHVRLHRQSALDKEQTKNKPRARNKATAADLVRSGLERGGSGKRTLTSASGPGTATTANEAYDDGASSVGAGSAGGVGDGAASVNSVKS